MKKKDLKELKSKTVDELTKDVLSLKKEIVELSHDIKMGKSTASASLRTKKKNVATLLTVMGQMRLNPVSAKKVEEKVEEKTEAVEKPAKKTKGETK